MLPCRVQGKHPALFYEKPFSVSLFLHCTKFFLYKNIGFLLSRTYFFFSANFNVSTTRAVFFPSRKKLAGKCIETSIESAIFLLSGNARVRRSRSLAESGVRQRPQLHPGVLAQAEEDRALLRHADKGQLENYHVIASFEVFMRSYAVLHEIHFPLEKISFESIELLPLQPFNPLYVLLSQLLISQMAKTLF